VQVAKGNLQRQKDNIVTMTRDLERGDSLIVYGGQEYKRTRIQKKLDADFRSYQHSEAELKSKEKLLEAKERSLESAREQLAQIRTQKQELEVQVGEMEAELKNVRLAQTHCKFQFDDSSLAQCKATLAEIKNRLQVEKKKTELDGEFANDNAIPVERKEKTVSELTKEIQAYFGQPSATDGKVVDRK
jgi:chromosome segregation ATPase